MVILIHRIYVFDLVFCPPRLLVKLFSLTSVIKRIVSINSSEPIILFCRWFTFLAYSSQKTCFFLALAFWGTFSKISSFSSVYPSYRIRLFFEEKTNNSFIFNSHSVDLFVSSLPFGCLQFLLKLQLFFFLFKISLFKLLP